MNKFSRLFHNYSRYAYNISKIICYLLRNKRERNKKQISISFNMSSQKKPKMLYSLFENKLSVKFLYLSVDSSFFVVLYKGTTLSNFFPHFLEVYLNWDILNKHSRKQLLRLEIRKYILTKLEC